MGQIGVDSDTGAGGVVGPEGDFVLDDVIGRIPRILRAEQTVLPELWRTLLVVTHAAAVSVRVTPVCAGLVLDVVRNAVSIGVSRVHVVEGVVLRVGAVEVLLPVHHSAVVRVRVERVGDVGVSGTVSSAHPGHVLQVATGVVLEVVVERVTVRIEIVVARHHRVGAVEHLIEVVDAVAIRIILQVVREPSPYGLGLFPVGQSIAVGVHVIVVAMYVGGGHGAPLRALVVAPGAILGNHTDRTTGRSQCHSSDHIACDRGVGERGEASAGVVVVEDARQPGAPVQGGRVDAGGVGDGQALEVAVVGDDGGAEVHEGHAWVGAVRQIALVAVTDAAEVGVVDVPQSAGEVLHPILKSIIVEIACILSAGRVGLAWIDLPVAVEVLVAIIEPVTVGVVVARVAVQRRVSVAAEVRLDAIRDAI